MNTAWGTSLLDSSGLPAIVRVHHRQARRLGPSVDREGFTPAARAPRAKEKVICHLFSKKRFPNMSVLILNHPA